MYTNTTASPTSDQPTEQMSLHNETSVQEVVCPAVVMDSSNPRGPEDLKYDAEQAAAETDLQTLKKKL
jgi:hypothetical protein